MTHVPKAVEVFLRAGDFERALEGFVSRKDGSVSFVEIKNMLAPYMETEGDYAFSPPDAADLNIWCWGGMSLEWIELMKRMISDHRLKISPCHMLVYYVDGMAPRWPVAKKPPKKGYTKPHWLPVVFDLVKP